MEYPITPSSILDYTYCPRRWYLHTLECQNSCSNIYLTEGSIEHENVDISTSKFFDNTLTLTNMTIYDDIHNLYGVCDMVEMTLDENGVMTNYLDKPVTIYPIEYKHGKIRDCIEYKAQLIAQILCLEYMFNCQINYGYIYFVDSDERVRVDATEKLRDFVISVINELTILQNSTDVIKPKYSKKCQNCSVVDICNPRNTQIESYIKDMWKIGDTE